MGLLCTTIACFLAAKSSAVPERRVLMPFDYENVRLTGGLLEKQLADAKEFYLRIPDDDLLLGFRRRAGKPAPGVELGGWYSDDVFHIFGQILSGLSRMYAATGDPACKAKAEALYEGWRDCIASDGYFYYSRKPNAPHYIYDKMVGGLVDMAAFLGRTDALESLARITRWAEKHLDRARPYGVDGNEWYTLSENLYRAYLLSGDRRYRDFAQVWEYTPYWNLYAQGKSIFSVSSWMKKPTGVGLPDISSGAPDTNIGYHAYSHVNTLGGAALAYRVTGEERYLDAIRNAYDFLQRDECFATGGFGPDESLLQTPELVRRLDSTSATFETQCGSWAIFKLCKNLIALTGDARYGDWVELAAYNGIAATLPETPDGKVLYYSNYNPFGAQKLNHWDGWSCCAGTRPMAVADVDDLVYFRARDGIDVNLFVPSKVSLDVQGESVQLEQETAFPESATDTFRVHLGAPRAFTLRVRSAGWFAGPVAARINGKPVALGADGKHWLGLRRVWRDGDRLEIVLPMAAKAVSFGGKSLFPAAVRVGPVVLAFRSPNTNPADRIDLSHLQTELIPSPGEPLAYHLRQDPRVLARPFYAFKEGEPYFLYLDSSAIGTISYRQMRAEGKWRDSGHFWFSNQVGAWCETAFEGDSARLIGWRFDDGGIGEVTVDGKVVGRIDQYGPGRDLPFTYRVTGLGPGRHVLRITVLPEKDAASKDRYLNVGGIQVPR